MYKNVCEKNFLRFIAFWERILLPLRWMNAFVYRLRTWAVYVRGIEKYSDLGFCFSQNCLVYVTGSMSFQKNPAHHSLQLLPPTLWARKRKSHHQCEMVFECLSEIFSTVLGRWSEQWSTEVLLLSVSMVKTEFRQRMYMLKTYPLSHITKLEPKV